MPADLRAAHLKAGRIVDGLYGLTKPAESTRVATLLRKHHELAGTALPQLELELAITE